MKKNVIVSLADSNYFELLNELVDSIKSFEKSKDTAICILDAGLSEKQREILSKKVDEIKPAEWDIKLSTLRVRGREWLKAMTARVYLPKYFPKYENFIWIDCDAWVNNWEAIELLIKASKKDKIGLTQSIAPGYRNIGKVKWFFADMASIKTQNYKHAKKSGFSNDICRKIAFAPHINSGVFSLNINSKIWKIWQEILETAVSKGVIFASEQIALNIAVYCHNIPVEFLPTRCNWIVNHLLPKYDQQLNQFIEPNLPNNPIGIIHLAGGIWINEQDMRLNNEIKINIHTTDDKIILKSLRFGH
jgi:lipopolysaccharide biosynthesis glycosyltransferase